GLALQLFYKANISGHDPGSYTFFFSSRRRHTSCYRDWSSDVCSSDLPHRSLVKAAQVVRREAGRLMMALCEGNLEQVIGSILQRSEERRVGKEFGAGKTRLKVKEKCIDGWE